MNICHVVSGIVRHRALAIVFLIAGCFLCAVPALDAGEPSRKRVATGSATRPDYQLACNSARNTCSANLGICPSGSSVGFLREGSKTQCDCVRVVRNGKLHFKCNAVCMCIPEKPKKTEPTKLDFGQCGDPAVTKSKPCAGGCIPAHYTCCQNGSWCADGRRCLPEPGACELP
jgi:hypothetical protein